MFKVAVRRNRPLAWVPTLRVFSHAGPRPTTTGRGSQVGRAPCRPCAVACPGDKPKAEGADDLVRDLVLHGEDVSEVPVVTVRPDVHPRRGVDQLGRDAHPIVDLPYTSFDHMADAQLATNLCHAYRLTLVGKGRVARDDLQAGDS